MTSAWGSVPILGPTGLTCSSVASDFFPYLPPPVPWPLEPWTQDRITRVLRTMRYCSAIGEGTFRIPGDLIKRVSNPLACCQGRVRRSCP